MSSLTASERNTASQITSSRGRRRPPSALARTAARAGWAAMESVLFLGFGAAMMAGALLFR